MPLKSIRAWLGIDSAEQQQEHWSDGWRVLRWLAGQQGEHLADEKPARRFVELVGAALRSGRAHLGLANPQPGREAPPNPTAWGWRPRPGVAPVCAPSATTSVPATITCSMPTG